MTTNPDMQQDTRHALETCALAMITLATHNGIVKNDNGEIKHVMHVKADTYDFVLTEEIMGDESMGKHWLGHPQSVDCREEGIVIIKAECTKTRCQNKQTGQIMTVGEAEQKVTLLKSRRKRDLDKLKTSQWDTNMFQQWIMYSAQAMFDAKKQKRRDCIACYNAKRIPQVQSIPGSELGDCPDSTKCFTLCALFMAGGLPGWSKDKKICPTLHHDERDDIVGAIPPVVHKPANIIFPYCITRGKGLERVLKDRSAVMGDARGLVKCSTLTWHPKDAIAQMKVCETGPNAHIRCAQVVPNRVNVIYERNSSYVTQYLLPDLKEGTQLLGDIFWTCENNDVMMPRLPANWTGICAPVMVTIVTYHA